MKIKPALRKTALLVWKDKWEVILAFIGFGVQLISPEPIWSRALSVILLIILAWDISSDARWTYFAVKEKHIPLAVIVGPGQVEPRTMVRQVEDLMGQQGFDARRYEKAFGLTSDAWQLVYAWSLPDARTEWNNLCQSFKTKVRRIADVEGEKRVLHLFLKCPAALAMATGAALNLFHPVIAYHYLNGSYQPVMDLSGSEGDVHPGPRAVREPVEGAFQHVVTDTMDEALTGDVFVGLRYASHEISAPFWDLAAAQGAAKVCLRRQNDKELTVKDDWLALVRETYQLVNGILNKPSVQRMHLALNCPLPVAFALGMALGPQSPVDVYQYMGGKYVHVLSLDQLAC